MRRLVLPTTVLTLLLSVSCSGDSTPPAEFLNGDGLASSMEMSLQQAVSSMEAPLQLTQAEFQDSAGELWWVTQFEDPVLTASAGIDVESLIYRYPLEVLKTAVRQNADELRQDAGVSTFIIAFRDPKQSVYEIDSDLMWSYVDGDKDWREVVDEMSVSELNY